MILFSDRKPAAWELAIPSGLDRARLGADPYYAYGVDSATGCFASPEALRGVASGAYDDALATALDETYVDTWSWANVACGDGGENIIAFSTGFGDGAYPTYWGLDAAGTITVAMTDFLVLDLAADLT